MKKKITKIRLATSPFTLQSHTHITDVWVEGEGSCSVSEIIRRIENGREEFVSAHYPFPMVSVIYSGYSKFIKTQPDFTNKDNLLNLPRY